MTEIFEVHDLHLIPRLSVVDVIDDLMSGTEPNQIDIKFISNGINEADQILILLFGAIHIALLVNEPGDLRLRSGLFAYLLRAQAGRPRSEERRVGKECRS